MKRQTIIDLLASLLILLWMYAAISKLLEYNTFKEQLAKSPFISSFSALLAWGLPIIELLIAASLIWKRTVRIGLMASFFLMSVFTFYIIGMLNFSYHLPCSCGGIISKLSWTQHLWFNLFWVALSLAAVILERRHPPAGKRSYTVVDGAATQS